MEKEKLREIIREKLAVCDTLLYPVLCRMKGLQDGQEKIEEMIIHFAMQEAMPVDSALAHIECEFKQILITEEIELEEL